MVQPPLNQSLGDLTVANGATESNAILAAGPAGPLSALEQMESLQIAAPASIGTATLVTVESLDQIGGSIWGDHLSGGATITLIAGQRVTITDIPLAGIRLKVDLDPGANIVFPVTGKLSKQGLARVGIHHGPA